VTLVRNLYLLDVTQFSLTFRSELFTALFVYLNLYILFVIYFLLLSLRYFALRCRYTRYLLTELSHFWPRMDILGTAIILT